MERHYDKILDTGDGSYFHQFGAEMKVVIGKKSIAIAAVLTIAAAGLVFGHTGTIAVAEDRDDLVAQQQATADQISKLKSQITGLDLHVQETFLKLTETKDKITTAESELADAQAELSAAEREAQKNEALLISAQDELGQIQLEKQEAEDARDDTLKSLGELARATYRGDFAPSSMELVIGTSSAEDFMNAYRANSAITRNQTTLLDAQNQAEATAANREARQESVEAVIADLKAKADELVAEREITRQNAQTKRDSLNTLKTEYENFVKELQSQKTEIETSIVQQQEAQAEITAKIAKIDEENRRRAAEEKARREREQAAKSQSAVGGVEVTSNYWIQTPLPKPLRITSPFAYRINPVSGRSEFHPAIDIGSPCGTVQRASADGTIAGFRYASDGNPYGNAIYINHGIVNGSSWVTFHAHLSRIDVKLGQHVSKGEPVGLTGTTGWSTGCHLHYEVHQNGTAINPMSLPSFQ